MRLVELSVLMTLLSSGVYGVDFSNNEKPVANWKKSAFSVVEGFVHSHEKEAYAKLYRPIIGFWTKQELVDKCPVMLRSVFFDESRTGNLANPNLQSIKFKLKNFCVSDTSPTPIGCMPIQSAATCLALLLDTKGFTTTASLSRTRLLSPTRELADYDIQRSFAREFIKQMQDRQVDPQTVYMLVRNLPFSPAELKELFNAIPSGTAANNQFFQIDPGHIYSLIHVYKEHRRESLDYLCKFVTEKQIMKSLTTIKKIYSQYPLLPGEENPLRISFVNDQTHSGRFIVELKKRQ